MTNDYFERLCNILGSLSHLELLGVRSRVRLGSSRTRLLFLSFLFLLLPFSPQIPSWTPARMRTDRQNIAVDGLTHNSVLTPHSEGSRELMLATIATTNSWANLALAKGATGCHVIQPEYEMTKMMQVMKHSYIEKFVNTAGCSQAESLSCISECYLTANSPEMFWSG